jgi:hypothetical protein
LVGQPTLFRITHLKHADLSRNTGKSFVKMLMAHDYGTLDAARVRIDGSGSRDFQRALNSYLRRELGARIKDAKMADSNRDPLMQLHRKFSDLCDTAPFLEGRAPDLLSRKAPQIAPRSAPSGH